MKLKKKNILLLGFVFAVIFLISIISASFELSTASLNITDTYSPGEFLKGKIELKLQDEPFNSIFEASFGGHTSQTMLLEFLQRADANYTCSSNNCNMTYSAVNSGMKTKTFSLSTGQSKIVGFKLTGDVISASDFMLSISSDGTASCNLPLKIDIGNDGKIDWTSQTSTEDFSCYSSYGCYAPSGSDKADITNNPYCEQITIPASAKIKIGADIAGIGSKIFKMSIYNDEYSEKSCSFTASGSGEYGCNIELNTDIEQKFNVCIFSEDINSGYSIGREQTEPCGYAGYDSSELTNDFAIFAKKSKYAPAGQINLKSEEIDSAVSDYIYENDCTNGCVIPIKITAGQNQEIVLSEASLLYSSEDGISSTTTDLYDITQSPSLISMTKSVLDLVDAKLNTPKKYGDYELMLSLSGKNLFSDKKEITVIEAPIIETIYPQKAPAALQIFFTAYFSGANVTKYSWDFGDNSSELITSENKAVHIYSAIGSYTLKLKIENKLGISEKEFSIEVINPEEYIDISLNESQAGIANVREQLKLMPDWVASYLKSKLNLESIESEIIKLKTDYAGAGGSSEKYVKILTSLNNLNVPSSIKTGKTSSTAFYIDKNKINLAALSALGAGDVEGNAEDYKTSILGWSLDNLKIVSEGETYSYTNGGEISLASRIKITITTIPSSASLNNIYFAIGEKSGEISFKDSSLQTNLKSADSHSGLILSSLSGKKEIELMLPQKIDIIDVPIYFSVGFSELSVISEIEACNNNGNCEPDIGENSDNCRHDCKPLSQILLWLFILLFIAFCTYIALQEWYKRRYENYLFKNKNDLFNLVNFIDNAEKQGLSYEQTIGKLKEKKWTGEKIVYAWKKYKGLRTGMWEIPIFNLFERKMLQKHVLKLRQDGISGRIAPISHDSMEKKLNLKDAAFKQ